MQETAIITDIDDKYFYYNIVQDSHCSGCARYKSCNILNSKTPYKLEKKLIDRNLNINDKIELEFKTNIYGLNLFLIFICPIIAAISGYLFGTYIMNAIKPELLSLIFLIIYFLIIFIISRLFPNIFRNKPDVLFN